MKRTVTASNRNGAKQEHRADSAVSEYIITASNKQHPISLFSLWTIPVLNQPTPFHKHLLYQLIRPPCLPRLHLRRPRPKLNRALLLRRYASHAQFPRYQS